MNTTNPANIPEFPTTAQIYHAALARHALESEPRPGFEISAYTISCENPESPPGMRKYIADFQAANGIQSFDGRNWIQNEPA